MYADYDDFLKRLKVRLECEVNYYKDLVSEGEKRFDPNIDILQYRLLKTIRELDDIKRIWNLYDAEKL